MMNGNGNMEKDEGQSEPEICARYSCKLLERFSQFRRDGMLFDYTIQVDTQEFQAHKLVLAAGSDYFCAVFSHNMVESSQSKLKLNGLNPIYVKNILDFLYTGRLSINLSNVSETIQTATFLQVPEAIAVCADFVRKETSFQNVDELGKMAQQFGLLGFDDYQKRYTLDNFKEFSESDLFLDLDAKTLMNYMEEDCLKIRSEMQLLEAVLQWYKHDKEARNTVIHDILARVRYPVGGIPLISFAEKMEPFTSNDKCKTLLSEATEYLKKPHLKLLHQSYKTRVRGTEGLILVGGEDSGGVLRSCYFSKTGGDRWTLFPSTHSHSYLTCLTLTSANNFGILVGGYADDCNERGSVSKSMRLLTPETDYVDLKPLKQARARHVSVFLPEDKILVVIGGKAEKEILSSVEIYDMASESWSYGSCLENGLYNHAGVVFNNQVYITGGMVNDKHENKTKHVSNTLCYNPKTNQWTQKAPMPTAREDHGMAVLPGSTSNDEQFIVCGGTWTCMGEGTSPLHYSPQEFLSSVEVYSVANNQWTAITNMKTPAAGVSVVAFKGNVLVAGGYNSKNDVLDDIQMYDPKKMTWSSFGKLPKKMNNFGLCTMTVKHGAEESWASIFSMFVDGNGLEDGVEYDYENDDYDDYDDYNYDTDDYYGDDGEDDFDYDNLWGPPNPNNIQPYQFEPLANGAAAVEEDESNDKSQKSSESEHHADVVIEQEDEGCQGSAIEHWEPPFNNNQGSDAENTPTDSQEESDSGGNHDNVDDQGDADYIPGDEVSFHGDPVSVNDGSCQDENEYDSRDVIVESDNGNDSVDSD